MSKSSIKYIDTSYMYRQQPVAAPVSNPVIYGNFPKFSHRKSSVEKINKFLSSILLLLVILSLVSYYFVSDGERNMNNLGREIALLSTENIELQNKLDNLNSFNNVGTIIKDSTTLDTAEKVIEIPAVNTIIPPQIQSIPVNYNWSIGY